MLLTPIEEQQLIQAARLLESTQDIPILTAAQVPIGTLLELMASDKVDLAMIGCYLTSRLDPSVDLFVVIFPHAKELSIGAPFHL